MRIIAGSRKGHRIAAPRGLATRPTSDRVREAAFNLIGSVERASVLELFAGSGAMGLEALSRGAERCLFVDSGRESCRTIEANLRRLRLAGGSVCCRDALALLREEVRAGRRYDLVLVDAPYERWGALEPELAALLPGALAENGLLLVETAAAVSPELPLERVTSRRYGSARLTLFRP